MQYTFVYEQGPEVKQGKKKRTKSQGQSCAFLLKIDS